MGAPHGPAPLKAGACAWCRSLGLTGARTSQPTDAMAARPLVSVQGLEGQAEGQVRRGAGACASLPHGAGLHAKLHARQGRWAGGRASSAACAAAGACSGTCGAPGGGAGVMHPGSAAARPQAPAAGRHRLCWGRRPAGLHPLLALAAAMVWGGLDAAQGGESRA